MNQLATLITALRWTEAACGLTPLVKAHFVGYQEAPGGSGLDLWTLDEEIPGHPAGSTLAASTIREAGYSIPNRRVEP